MTNKLTRQDYRLVARAIKEVCDRGYPTPQGAVLVAYRVADTFGNQYHNFNRDKFLAVAFSSTPGALVATN